MRLTAELKRRLCEGIDRQEWDRPGETTLADAAKSHIDAVPTGTSLDPEPSEYDVDGQPLSDVAHVLETVEFFGYEDVEGDWQDHSRCRPGVGCEHCDQDETTAATPRYPDVTVELVGQDGNAVAIIGRVARALREAHGQDVATEFVEEATSGDYDHVLRTVMRYVEVG